MSDGSSAYHVFLHLKNHLVGQRYDNSILQWLSHQAENFYDEGIKNLVVRYDKWLNIGGNYVGKSGILCKNKIVPMFLLVFYTSKQYLLKKHASYVSCSSKQYISSKSMPFSKPNFQIELFLQ